MVITYFDGLMIWDFVGVEGVDARSRVRLRFVQLPGGRELLYQAEDGSWQELDRPEQPLVNVIADWSMAQQIGEDMLQADPQLVGYESIADVATVRFGFEELVAHLWVDETGAVIRLIAPLFDSEPDFLVLVVWDVETLSPELTGPLPDQR